MVSRHGLRFSPIHHRSNDKGANVDVLKGKLFKAGAKAEIEARLAEDHSDENTPEVATI